MVVLPRVAMNSDVSVDAVIDEVPQRSGRLLRMR